MVRSSSYTIVRSSDGRAKNRKGGLRCLIVSNLLIHVFIGIKSMVLRCYGVVVVGEARHERDNLSREDCDILSKCDD